MILHYSGTILVCELAQIEDAEITHLCSTIIASHQNEIDQMKAKLQELEQ